MKKVLHFGAGNIGRGFIGLLLSRAGYRVIFADIAFEIIDAINQKKRYTVSTVGESPGETVVENIEGILSFDEEEVTKALSESEMVTTAVGPKALEKISPLIAKGLRIKLSQNPVRPLNIIACENMVGASEFLKQKVFNLLSKDEIEALEPIVGFPNAAVDRIVPPQNNKDLLAVMVEEYFEWVVDKKALRGSIPEIPGMTVVENLQAYVERKIFTLNTGHAVAAYFGYVKGYKTIQEALKDSEILNVVKGAMEESAEYLVHRFSFSRQAHREYIEKTLHRFKNPALEDDVVRVGRQPLRKLGPDDRLVYPAKEAAKLGLKPVNLACGIAAALKFDYEEDGEALALQNMIKNEGIDEVLDKICGIPRKSPLNMLVKDMLKHRFFVE